MYVNLAGSPCSLSSEFQLNLEPSWLQANPAAGVVTLGVSTSKDSGAVTSTYTTGVSVCPSGRVRV